MVMEEKRYLSKGVSTMKPNCPVCFGKFVICPCDDECVVGGECEKYTTLLIHHSDVIQELERKRDRRAEFIYDSSTNPMVAAYNEAISLIRGVK